MFTTFVRLIKYGFQSVRRSALISIATIIIMMLAMIVLQGLLLFRAVERAAITSLQDKIDISADMDIGAPEDSIFALQRSLEALPEVERVEYVSREKALELFKERKKDDPDITQALELLGTNPLPASLNVKAHDPQDYGEIAEFLNRESFSEIVDTVTYSDSRVIIERLNRIAVTTENLGLALTIFLGITASLVIFNTIRLAIYANRDEIAVMRLVGASDVFINGPYIVQAIIFAIVGSVLSLLITAPFVNVSAEKIGDVIGAGDFNMATYFYENLPMFFIYLLLFGIILGITSGVIAIRRYLHI